MKYIDFINAKNALITSFGAIGGIFASAFGGWNTGLTTLVIFMAVDYVTGLIVAGVFHKSKKTEGGTLESRAGFQRHLQEGNDVALRACWVQVGFNGRDYRC